MALFFNLYDPCFRFRKMRTAFDSIYRISAGVEHLRSMMFRSSPLHRKHRPSGLICFSALGWVSALAFCLLALTPREKRSGTGALTCTLIIITGVVLPGEPLEKNMKSGRGDLAIDLAVFCSPHPLPPCSHCPSVYATRLFARTAANRKIMPERVAVCAEKSRSRGKSNRKQVPARKKDQPGNRRT